MGESNYFEDYPETVSVFRDADKWYTADTDRLIPEEMKSKVNNWIDYRTFNAVFNIMHRVLGEAGIVHGDKLAETAFYNYFLRPALNDGGSKGFNPEGIDNEVAGVAMTGVIDRLNPDLVVFLSKKAYDEFTKYCRRCGLEHGDVIIAAVAHPASPWWNRRDGIYGKKKFEAYLKGHWIAR